MNLSRRNFLLAAAVTLAAGHRLAQAQDTNAIPRNEILKIGRGRIASVGWLGSLVAVAGGDGVWLYDGRFGDRAFWDVGRIERAAWHGNTAAVVAEKRVSVWHVTPPAWNVEFAAREIFWREYETRITALDWDGARLALALENGGVEVLDANGETLATLHRDASVLKWHHHLLAVGGADGILDVWDADAKSTITVIDAHPAAIRALAWHPGGDILASGGDDALINLWDVSSGTQVDTLEGHSARVQALDWHGTRLASAGGHQFEGSEVRLWQDGQTVAVFRGHAAMTHVQWNDSGSRLLACGQDNLPRLWDAAGRPVATLQGHMGGVEDVAWNTTGSEVVAACDDGVIRIFYAVTGAPIASFQGHARGTNAVGWSPDGELIASAGWDNTIRVWVRGSGKTRSVLRGHEERIWSVAWHPAGRFIASASRDLTVRVWNAYTGEVLHKLTGPGDEIMTVRYSPDGSRIAASSDDGSVWVWDAVTGEALRTMRGHERYAFTMDWHPTRDELISGSWFDGTLRLWDASSGARLGHFSSMRVTAVKWNQRGGLLAAADADGVIRIWDLASGDTLSILDEHAAAVYAVAWRPDGRQLASGSSDGTIRIWG